MLVQVGESRAADPDREVVPIYPPPASPHTRPQGTLPTQDEHLRGRHARRCRSLLQSPPVLAHTARERTPSPAGHQIVTALTRRPAEGGLASPARGLGAAALVRRGQTRRSRCRHGHRWGL
jgi:hypothetical protein